MHGGLLGKYMDPQSEWSPYFMDVIPVRQEVGAQSHSKHSEKPWRPQNPLSEAGPDESVLG